MKRLIAVLMMLCPVAVMGQTKPATGQTKPATGQTTKAAGQTSAVSTEFPLTVHVVSSRLEVVSDKTILGGNFLDLLRVEMKGRKYLLTAVITRGIFAYSSPLLIEPGIYPARIIEDSTPNPGEILRTYQLRLANGKKVKAYLWGMGK